jgi:hypothetical protein
MVRGITTQDWEKTRNRGAPCHGCAVAHGLIEIRKKGECLMRTYKLALTSVVLGIVALVAAVVTPMPPAWAAGALAVGGGSFEFLRNHESMRVARSMALGNCGNSKSEIVMSFEGTCVA